MNARIKTHVRRAAAAGAALSIAGTLGMAAAAPASAAGKNGRCETGEFCLYYLTNYRGPIFDLYYSDGDFSDDYFPGTSIPADNNTESDWNRDTFTWYVYTGYYGGGAGGYVAPGEYGNLNNTFKNTVSSAYYY